MSGCTVTCFRSVSFVDPLFNDAEKTKIHWLAVSTAARETEIDIVEKVTEAPAMGTPPRE